MDGYKNVNNVWIFIFGVSFHTKVLLDHYFCTDIGIIGCMAHEGVVSISKSKEKWTFWTQPKYDRHAE